MVTKAAIIELSAKLERREASEMKENTARKESEKLKKTIRRK